MVKKAGLVHTAPLVSGFFPFVSFFLVVKSSALAKMQPPSAAAAHIIIVHGY